MKFIIKMLLISLLLLSPSVSLAALDTSGSLYTYTPKTNNEPGTTMMPVSQPLLGVTPPSSILQGSAPPGTPGPGITPPVNSYTPGTTGATSILQGPTPAGTPGPGITPPIPASR